MTHYKSSSSLQNYMWILTIFKIKGKTIKRTINEDCIKSARKVHQVTFCYNVHKDQVTPSEALTTSIISHIWLGCYRISSPFFSPYHLQYPSLENPTWLGKPGSNPPFLTPPASPSVWFFTCSTVCLQGVTWKWEGRRRGEGKAGKPYSVATTTGPMILLILIFLLSLPLSSLPP